jgi:hypothetical protein
MKLQINFCEACVAPFWRHSCVTVGWKNRGIPLHGYLTMNTRKLSICTAVSLANALFVANAVQAQDGSDSERIEEVYVYGQRAMMEGAIQRQRDSDQIMSVITRDAIGNFRTRMLPSRSVGFPVSTC